MAKEIAESKKLRQEYLKTIDSLRIALPQDTILLDENYDFICFGCPANIILVQVRDLYISFSNYNYKSKLFEKRYIKVPSEQEHYEDVRVLRAEARKNDRWNAYPKKYGTEDVFDGGHTFYTLIYPDNKIISMYMRAWNYDFRMIKDK